MATYRVLKKSWLHTDAGPRLYNPGEIVEYDGAPGAGLEPLDDAAVEAKKRFRPADSRLPNGLQSGAGR